MATQKSIPVVAVTMGDFAGIGPEIVAKSLLKKKPPECAIFVVVGDERILEETCRKLQISRRPKPWDGRSNLATFQPGVYIRSLTRVNPKQLRMGVVDKRWGAAAMQYVRYAAEMAMAKRADAVVTAPLSKEAIHKAGYPFEGHTDYLASLAGTPTVRMMFLGKKLRVILATVHVALSKVPGKLTEQSVLDTIRLGGKTLQELGIANPRIDVCGVNPHAGEAGAFGAEDKKKILPAILAAARLGWDVRGPFSADSLFPTSSADLIVAMYHDQGLIPFKMVHFDSGVNTTVGLGFVRTSPDHGTAYDIAGEGIADPRSMNEAIHWAIVMSRTQR